MLLVQGLLECLILVLELYPLGLPRGDTEFLSVVSALETSPDVQVVVFDDPQNDIRSRYAVGPLSLFEHALNDHVTLSYQSLDLSVDVFSAVCRVGDGVVGDIVDVVFSKELYSDDPWAGHEHLVDPLAVLQYLGSFKFIHHDFAFLLNRLFVSAYTYDQIRVGE